jgi:acetoin utilization protein AcuB
MIVSEVMSQNPRTISATATVAQAWRALQEADIRHLPVVDGGALVGIISDRDLKSVIPSELEALERPAEMRALMSQPISNLMSSDVVSAREEDDLAEVVDSMIELRIGAVPVIAPDSDELVGIVSVIDVLRAVRDEL